MNLAATVEQLCAFSGTNVFELSAKFGQPPNQFWQTLKRPGEASATFLFRLANALDVSVDELISGKVDEQAYFSRVVRGEIPARFLQADGSKLRTTLPVLKYVSDRYGVELYRYLLRRLGLSEVALNEADRQVSIDLLNEALNLLRERGFSEQEFYAMGEYSAFLPQNQRIASEYRELKNHAEIFEYMTENIFHHYEQNFRYKILKRDSQSVTIDVVARDEMQSNMGRKLLDNHWVCVYRQGVAAAHPVHAKLRPARLEAMQTPHRGDETHRFQLVWD